MELYGLADKDGNAYILHINGHLDELNVSREEPEPVFKVGDWVKYRLSNGTYGELFKITEFKGTQVRGDCYDGTGECWQCDKDILHPVSPQEIESHLKKICDEKYIGKRVIDVMPYPLGGGVHGLIINQIHIHPYDAAEDSFWMCVLDENNDVKGTCVYYQGKFAKIVPDKPKELPKTIGELGRLLYEFRAFNKEELHTIREFIKNQGYETE